MNRPVVRKVPRVVGINPYREEVAYGIFDPSTGLYLSPFGDWSAEVYAHFPTKEAAEGRITVLSGRLLG